MPMTWNAEKPTTVTTTMAATAHQRRSRQASRSRLTPAATAGASSAMTPTLVSSQNSGTPSA